jgi:hypothetical protein
MQLLNPIGLLLLGLIPVLLIIHSLKPRPKRMTLSNFFLWQEVLKERKGGFRIQKIMTNLPLLLQILAIILGAVALGDPVWTYPTSGKGDIILVFDTSASMKTEKEGQTRFDIGRQEALEFIDRLEDGSRMLIIEAGKNPVLKAPFSDDKAQLEQAVRAMRPTDQTGQIEKALLLGLSFTRPEKEDRIVLITDSAAKAVEPLIKTNPRIQPVIISQGERNIGITRFEVRRVYHTDDSTQFFLEVKNFNPYSVLCPVRITHKGVIIVEETIGLRPNEKKGLVFPKQGLLSGVAQAQILVKDDFIVDNEAAMAIETSQDIRVLLLGQENFFLLQLLKSLPNLIVNTVSDLAVTSWEAQSRSHDIVILNRVSPPSTEKGNFILFDSFSPSIPLIQVGDHSKVTGLDWDTKSPLLKGLSFEGLRLEQVKKIQSEGDLKPLLGSNETGLIYAYEREGLKAVLFGFDLNHSDLPLRVAFPVLFSNILKWFHPDRFTFTSLKIETGETFPIYLKTRSKALRVGRPSGRWEEYREVSNPFSYTATDESGIYTVIENDDWRHFAANLVNEMESDIRVPDSLVQLTSGPSALTTKRIEARYAFWLICVLLFLSALYLEWVLWMKGS